MVSSLFIFIIDVIKFILSLFVLTETLTTPIQAIGFY
jgi:hypothetical protein